MKRYFLIKELDTLEVYVTQPLEKQPKDSIEFFENTFVKAGFDIYPNPLRIVEIATPEQIAEAQKESVPNEVALWKIRFVLSQMQLEQSVTEAINLLEEPQRTAATYIWNFGTAVDRYSNTVIFIKTALGLTEQEVDDIFINADKITL